MSLAGEVLDAMGVARDAFAQRVAVLTGGARGIGAATARLLAERGARVVIIDVLDSAPIVDEMRACGGEASAIVCDVSDAARFAEVLQTLGTVDIVVNAAGDARIGRSTAISVEQWDRGYAVNVRAPFVAMRTMLPGMLARRHGVFVSLLALETVPFGVAFGPAKAALRATTASMAQEIGADSGVSLFSVLPGVVETPGFRAILGSVAPILGMTEEQFLTRLVRNPGYEGPVPVGDFAAALVYLITRAREYHGQVADPFEPLARFGLTPVPPVASTSSSSSSSEDWARQFEEVNAANRQLEIRIKVRTEQLVAAHARSEALLRNILPSPIAERLKERPEIIADSFDDVAVVFADLVGFTELAAALPPTRVVAVLDEVFSAFDRIASEHGLEKIKTIGDCYMVVGGLPEPSTTHLASAARAALAFRVTLADVAARVGMALVARIGLHVGPVVAGVIGKQKFIYDLWGDTVNTASRMESHGIAGGIQCTDAVRARLVGEFAFEDRGVVEVKGKGPMRAWLLVGESRA